MAATKTRKTDDGAAAASAAPSPPKRQLLTAALADQALERREQVHDFELTATMPGAFARVRRVDLNDQVTLMALPERHLRFVLGMVNDVESQEGKEAVARRTNEDGTLNVEAVIKVATLEAKMIDGYCLAGFVEPRLVLTQEEVDRERGAPDEEQPVLLSAVHPADRRRFYLWCTGQDAEATATVETFPGEPDAGVAAGGPGGVDRGAAQ